jgi:hypothetical protein
MNEVLRKTTYTRKKKSFSKRNEFFLREGASSLGRNVTSPRSNILSLRNNGPFLNEQSCFESFCNHNHFMFILYKFMTYHWKGVENGYNFVVGSTSIRIHMKKLCLHKVLNTFVPSRTWLFPKAI